MNEGEQKFSSGNRAAFEFPLEWYIQIPLTGNEFGPPDPIDPKYFKMYGLFANPENYTKEDVKLHFKIMLEGWAEDTEEQPELKTNNLDIRMSALKVMLDEEMYPLLKKWCLYEASCDLSLSMYGIGEKESELARENAQDWLDRAAALEKEIEKENNS